MYTFESRIRYSETGSNMAVTLPGIINYFQDCSTFQSESTAYGIRRLKEEGKAWILSYWQIVIERYPLFGEKIEVSTWPTGFRSFIGERNFQMVDEAGCRAAYANSVWAYMDMKKGRPVRPSEEEIAGYGMGEPLEMDYAPRKIARAKAYIDGDMITVRRCQMDSNEHMNNCQYVQMALDALPEEQNVWQVRVEYKKPAVYNDRILPRIAREDGRTVVELCGKERAPYAIVEFAGQLIGNEG